MFWGCIVHTVCIPLGIYPWGTFLNPWSESFVAVIRTYVGARTHRRLGGGKWNYFQVRCVQGMWGLSTGTDYRRETVLWTPAGCGRDARDPRGPSASGRWRQKELKVWDHLRLHNEFQVSVGLGGEKNKSGAYEEEEKEVGYNNAGQL